MQRVVSLTPDCDGDAVLARVVPAGPACHDGTVSCFGRRARRRGRSPGGRGCPGTRGDRRGHELHPEAAGRPEPPLKKLGEESAELVMACADGDRERAVEEAADVVYHLTVALRALGVGLAEVGAALDRRAR